MVLAALGVLGDLLSGQRITLQRVFERVRRIELELGVPPSHYEPGRRADGPASPTHRRAGRRPRQDGGARGGASCERDRHARRRGHGHRQHLRQVRLLEPGRAAPDGDVRARRSASCSSASTPRPCSTSAAARRSSPTTGRRPGRPRASSASTSRTRPSRPSGSSAGRPTSSTASCARRSRSRSRTGEFALATALEVLEHVPDPEHTVAEMARCARGGHLLVSVPREPLWRALNLARGAYVRELGNTPGHVNHWSRRGFAALLSATGRSSRRARRSRGRCCSPRCERRERRGLPATGAAPGSSRSASPPPALVTFAYFSVASHVLDDVALQEDLAAVVGDVRHRLGPLQADRAAALAHDRRPARARARARPPAAHAAAASRPASRSPSCVVALALRGPIQDELFDGSATLYWVLVVAVLAYAASYFARGWLAGHQWFGLYGGLVFMEATSRLLFALAVAVGIAEGQSAVALGHGGRAARLARRRPARLRRRPPAPPGRAARARRELGVARGGRFALAVLAIMLAEQTLINAAVLTTDLTAADAAAAGFVFNVLLIARAPLQLFQAVQGSLLPHLAGPRGRARPRRGAPRRARHRAGHRRLRARGGRSACCCSARGRWTCCSTTAPATGAGASRSSPWAWAST